ncbi:MAG: CBS domain-containing protein [Pseudomonadota bacterium]|nr:MAG: CBS domain-containing protein [Pseudomonadota bacterium]
MSIAQLIRRPVETLPPTATCVDAAQLMRTRNIGSVIVAKDGEPQGVVTDRDLAVRVIAERREPSQVELSEVMSPHPIFLSIHRSLDDAIETMRDLGVRRIPVVNDDGQLEGILSMDDVISMLARQISQVGAAIEREIKPSTESQPEPARSEKGSSAGLAASPPSPLAAQTRGYE